MPTLPIYQVDAFTERPFAGNPAAVCPLEGPIPEALMQDIAAENNLSETAFFHPQGDAFSLRWFTPTTEVELCGHATLASAFVLMTALEPARSEVTFRTRSGLLPVRRRDAITSEPWEGSEPPATGSRRAKPAAPPHEFVLDFPAYPAAPADAETAARVAEALRLQPREVVRARSLYAVLDSAAAVRAFAPDFGALSRLPTALGITAAGADEARPVDFVARYFAPTYGVNEDPVTGSAYCTLAPYWGARLGKQALRARQVSRRGGEVSCALAGERVHIGGKARLVITGTLTY